MDTNQELFSNTCHFDLQRAKQYDSFVQFFAAFVSPKYSPNNAYRRCIEIIKRFELETDKNKEHTVFVREYQHIVDAIDQGKTAAVLTIENGSALEGDINKLNELYDHGVRSICLTWNGPNEIATGVGGDSPGGGLTSFGVEVVKGMNELGMLVDVSHITEEGFWDVVNVSASPIIASHSNAKAICKHRRNLTDGQFKALIKNKGVTGINLCPPFLSEGDTADISDVLHHIEHFMSLGGEDNVGMGADFDGISNTPKGIPGVECLGDIFEALLRMNYKEEQVKKIAGLNFLRVLEQIL